MASPMLEVLEALRAGNSFLVTSHSSPDGDAAGSMIAMGHLLKALGKRFTLYNISGMPEQFAWIELPGPVVTEYPGEAFDWVITLDCGDERRGGQVLTRAMERAQVIVIDHHFGNPMWGKLNWVEPERSSTGEMVGLLAQAAGVPLSGPLGQAVYLGLVSDTGRFTFGNTSPECMEMAASIIRQGLKPGVVNAQIENQWNPSRIHLWGEALTHTRMHFGGQLGVIRITQEQLDRLGATKADSEGLINYVLRIRGTKVALLVRQDADAVKVSLRSLDGVDIQQVAAAFGGGGHKSAAGATIAGNLEDLESQLIAAVGKVLES